MHVDTFDQLIQSGGQPWEPCADITDLDIWHQYDVPLVGTFRFRGNPMMFAALNPADPKLTFWCYIELSAADLALIPDTWDSVEDMYSLLSYLYKNRTIGFAVAENDPLRVKRWEVLLVGDIDIFLGKGVRQIPA